MSVFYNDDGRSVEVSPGSQYYGDLCAGVPDAADSRCVVPVYEYVNEFFGGMYAKDHIGRNAIILGLIMLFVRGFTFTALRYLTYSGK